MATDYFCYIDPIKGESLDGRHENWIDVISFNP
jgi:type VI protein secretion system component Hcp